MVNTLWAAGFSPLGGVVTCWGILVGILEGNFEGMPSLHLCIIMCNESTNSTRALNNLFQNKWILGQSVLPS